MKEIDIKTYSERLEVLVISIIYLPDKKFTTVNTKSPNLAGSAANLNSFVTFLPYLITTNHF